MSLPAMAPLRPQQTYHYRVQARNKVGHPIGLPSEAVKLQTQKTLPPPQEIHSKLANPSPLQKEELGVVLDWNTPSDVEEATDLVYQIQRCRGSLPRCTSSEQWENVASHVTTTSYQDTSSSLMPATTYTYRIQAFSENDQSIFSQLTEITIPSLFPGSPQSIQAEKNKNSFH